MWDKIRDEITTQLTIDAIEMTCSCQFLGKDLIERSIATGFRRSSERFSQTHNRHCLWVHQK